MKDRKRVKDTYDMAVSDLIIADYQAGTWLSADVQKQIAVVRMMQREHLGRLT